MDGFQAELLRRLPLGRAVLRGFGYMLDAATLADVFERHRGRCYERELRFDQLVYLIRDALTVHHGSGHRAFTAAERRGELPVAEANAYGKLARVPEALSQALLSAGATRLRKVFPIEPHEEGIPPSLRGLKLIAFDGKKLKNAAKRLKPLRGVPGKLLGGKLLVALDVARGLAMAMNADPDGERNDMPLVPELVSQVWALESEPILWLGDRQFGNLEVPALLAARGGDHFLLRAPKSLRLYADPHVPATCSVDAEGRDVRQEWGWIGATRDPRRRYVRRITLERPDAETVILLTDLSDAAAVPAGDLLAAYRLRWGIERVFQEVTEVFHLQTLIGATPRAMIFQAAMCLLLYNLIQVVRAYVAADGQQSEASVSSEKLFWDVRDQLTAWANLGDPAVAIATLAWPAATARRIDAPPTASVNAASAASEDAATVAGMQAWLRQTLRGSWKKNYVKAPPKRRRPPARFTHASKVPRGHGGHSSTWRILQAAKARPTPGPRS